MSKYNQKKIKYSPGDILELIDPKPHAKERTCEVVIDDGNFIYVRFSAGGLSYPLIHPENWKLLLIQEPP